MLEEIRIRKILSLDELCDKLRKVQLKGFPEICVYSNAKFEIKKFNKEEFIKNIHTPQPTVYKNILDRVNDMEKLFSRQGVDIFSLNGAIEYSAIDDQGESIWTLLPPLVEAQKVNLTDNGSITYKGIIGSELLDLIKKKDFKINEYFYGSNNPLSDIKMNVICDGSHRIEQAFRSGRDINILLISNIKQGFPYYAVPQHYSKLQVIPNRKEDPGTKLHIIEDPGHKALYRLFPTGGLYTGGVRAETLK